MARRKARKRRSRHQTGRKGYQIREAEEIERINDAILSRDLPLLRSFGRKKGGFLNDSVRQKAWPVLLHCASSHYPGNATKEAHKDEEQVKLDVARSFNIYPQEINAEERQTLRDALNRVIVNVLRPCPGLNYYQGFHDICTVFLLLFDEKHATALVENVALFFLRDAMLKTLEHVLRELTILDTLLRLEDEELYLFLSESGIPPYYCLSWVITWYSHDLNDFEKITRLFDFFLSSNPMMPLYFSAAVVLSRKTDILAMPSDFSEIHSFLKKLPQDLDIETLIRNSIKLEQRYSPWLLQKESSIALDTVSAVNTYDDLWANCTSRTLPASKRRVRAILAMKLEDRKPLKITRNTSSKISLDILSKLTQMHVDGPTMWAWVIFGVGVGTTAVLLSDNALIKDWLALAFL